MLRLKKLNTSGFSHHLLLPVLVAVAIAGVGAYVITHPKAAVNNGKIVYYLFNTEGKKGYTINADGSGFTTFSQGVFAVNDLNRTADNRFVVHGTKTSNYSGSVQYTDPQSTYTGCTNGTQQTRLSQTIKHAPNAAGLPVVTYAWAKTSCTDYSPISTSLYNVDADGKNKVTLSTDIPGSVSQLQWGPGGSRLYMLRAQANSFGVQDLLVRVQTGELKTLTSGVYDYALSGDGKKIVYRTPASSGQSNFFVANMDGSGTAKIFTKADCKLNSDSLNYDGTKFICDSGNASARSLVITNVSSGVTKVLDTISNGSYNDFAWSPNSDKIAFLAQDYSAKKYAVVVINPDGSGKTTLKTAPADMAGGFGKLDW